MKKVMLFLPILTLSLFFAFCNKANIQEAMAPVTSNETVASRNACQLEIFTDNLVTLQVCGLATNFQSCQGCPGSTTYSGLDYVNNYYGSFAVPPSITFSVTNLGTTTTDVRLSTGGSTMPTVTLGPGDCEVFTLDANCEFQ